MTEVRTVEVPVEVYVPVPASYTAPLTYPPAFPAEFTVEDLVDRIFTLYDLLDQANADRAHVSQLTGDTP